MRIRLIALAVLAVAGLTAFAPAPFTKTDRRKDQADALDALQGTWSMTEKTRMGPAGQVLNYSTTTQKVRIEKDSWQFVRPGFAARGGKGGKGGKGGGGGLGGGPAAGGFGGGPTSIAYKIVLDRKTRPMEFRIKRSTRTETDYMVGIVQVHGDTVKMLYRLGSRSGLGDDEPMPRSFDKAPEGWYSMTLKRDR
jgi:hypothetical protein